MRTLLDPGSGRLSRTRVSVRTRGKGVTACLEVPGAGWEAARSGNCSTKELLRPFSALGFYGRRFMLVREPSDMNEPGHMPPVAGLWSRFKTLARKTCLFYGALKKKIFLALWGEIMWAKMAILCIIIKWSLSHKYKLLNSLFGVFLKQTFAITYSRVPGTWL